MCFLHQIITISRFCKKILHFVEKVPWQVSVIGKFYNGVFRLETKSWRCAHLGSFQSEIFVYVMHLVLLILEFKTSKNPNKLSC